MNTTSSKKQYIMVFAFTAAAVLIYLICHKFDLSQPISIDQDKAIDHFIRTTAMDDGGVRSGILGICEYNIQNIIMFLMIKVCGNAWAGINVYYILSFFMISLSMYYFLSKIGISGKFSVGLAVLAAFVPFHIDRGEGQMMTSNFFLAPLFMSMFYDLVYCKTTEVQCGGYMALVCMAPFVDVRLSAMAGILFIIFLIQRQDWEFTKYAARYLIPLLAFTGLVGIVSSTLAISDIETAKDEGTRILDMIMPMRYHIVGKFSDMRLEYDVLLSAHGESGLNSLGFLFSFGFVYVLFGLFFEWNRDRRVAWMGMIAVIVILISGVCGIGSVIEYFGINITYWSRMAIFIIVCSVAAIGILIGNCSNYIENRYGNRVLAVTRVMVYMMFVAEFFELILRQNM